MSMARILIADDAKADLVNLQECLEELGHSVIACQSGSEAIELAESNKPDLIMLDIVMPDIDGYKACRELKNREVTRNIPVIMISSKSEKVDKIWAKHQGASGYITKPYTHEQLGDEIARQLQLFA